MTTQRRRALLLRIDAWLARRFPNVGQWGALNGNDHFYVEQARAAVAGSRDADVGFRRSMELDLVPRVVIRWYYLALDTSL